MKSSSQNYLVKGRVTNVFQEKGYCFVEPLEKLPATYVLPKGKSIFLHCKVNGGNLPIEGAIGIFTVISTAKGIQAVSVKWDEPTQKSASEVDEPIRKPKSDMKRFIHPYNFVSLPANGLGRSTEVDPFRRRKYEPHDRYNSKLRSGYIDCTLTTRTHWFIPHTDKSKLIDRHKALGYFTLDPVSAWNHNDPSEDTTCPAIPASSLRGMVRSVFETATLSCFSVFDPGQLDFRIAYDLEQVPQRQQCAVPHGRGSACYIPIRLVSNEESNSLQVQLLDGRGPRDPNNTLRVALIYAYEPRVLTQNRRTNTKQPGEETALWQNLGNLPDGSRVAALLPIQPVPHGSGRFHYREAITVVPAQSVAELQSNIEALEDGSQQPNKMLVFGYLHRTGPNIENKHHERIFFDWDADYNGPGAKGSIKERHERFIKDTTPSLTVGKEIIEAAKLSLQGYADRHAETVRQDPTTPRRLRQQFEPPYPSDFIQERPAAVTIQAGNLCYALIEELDGQSIVRGLYPVAMPRLSHDHSRGDLLHSDFHPCHNPDSLCPACRVFGWVRKPKPGEELKPDPDRVDAVAGHVRFTHAVLRGEWGTGDQRSERVTLAILGSPKPTTTEFYLQSLDGFEEAKKQRWPAALQTERRLLYRQEEAALRGRKYYRRREAVKPQNEDPARNGLRRLDNTRDSQNQTIHLLPPKMEFRFRVYFDNLTDEELGVLLFSISLQPPSSWEQGLHLRHALGHGKPLGMGACEITIDVLHIDDFQESSSSNRYSQVPTYNPLPPLNEPPKKQEKTKWKPFVDKFGNAWQQVEVLENTLKETRLELLELLRFDPPDGPMHYPPNPSGSHEENYRWFMDNRRGRKREGKPIGLNINLPSPLDERDLENRLPFDPTSA